MLSIAGLAILLLFVATPTAGSWCRRVPANVGSSTGISLQDLRYGHYAHAVFIYSSHDPDHRSFMKIVQATAEGIRSFGVDTALIDEEGSDLERQLVGKYGEGPLPRLVLYHDMPRNFHSKPMLLATELNSANSLIELVERHAADLDVDLVSPDSDCPVRRVKRGITHLSQRDEL